jgi:hypothetical protein
MFKDKVVVQCFITHERSHRHQQNGHKGVNTERVNIVPLKDALTGWPDKGIVLAMDNYGFSQFKPAAGEDEGAQRRAVAAAAAAPKPASSSASVALTVGALAHLGAARHQPADNPPYDEDQLQLDLLVEGMEGQELLPEGLQGDNSGMVGAGGAEEGVVCSKQVAGGDMWPPEDVEVPR